MQYNLTSSTFNSGLEKILFLLQVFTEQQEQELKSYVIECNEKYYGITNAEFKELTYHFAVKCEVLYPETWDVVQQAGKKWLRSFFNRNTDMKFRTAKQINANRTKAFSEILSIFIDKRSTKRESSSEENTTAKKSKIIDSLNDEGLKASECIT